MYLAFDCAAGLGGQGAPVILVLDADLAQDLAHAVLGHHLPRQIRGLQAHAPMFSSRVRTMVAMLRLQGWRHGPDLHRPEPVLIWDQCRDLGADQADSCTLTQLQVLDD